MRVEFWPQNSTRIRERGFGLKYRVSVGIGRKKSTPSSNPALWGLSNCTPVNPPLLRLSTFLSRGLSRSVASLPPPPASKSALIFCMAIKPQRRRSIHVANLNHTRQRGPQDLCACPYWMAGADMSAFVRERSKCASQEHDLRRPRPPHTFCMAGARLAHTCALLRTAHRRATPGTTYGTVYRTWHAIRTCHVCVEQAHAI